MKKKFALLGIGGFVAPRHLKAIKENNGELIASCDVVDSVGVIDSFYPDSLFFNNFNGFEKFISEIQSSKNKIDYLTVCTPNYLHHSHIRFGLINGMNVICEKPLVINTKLLKNLFELRKISKKEIFCILQLRINDQIFKLKKELIKVSDFLNCDLIYNTPRGKWYDYSWKGDIKKSGGILYNIGIHLFDILIWIFGKCINFEVSKNDNRSARGTLYFKNAKVKWNLSIDKPYSNNFESERKLIINNKEYELTGNFNDSHTHCYKQILKRDKIFNGESTLDSLYLVNEMSKV